MKAIRQFGWLRMCLAICALMVVGELAILTREVLTSRRELKQLARKCQERDDLGRLSPPADEASQHSIADDRVAVEASLDDLRRQLAAPPDSASDAATPATTSLEMYFALSKFVESTRAAASVAHIKFKPDERFGFASYANEGPDAALVPAVDRQRAALDELLHALIETQPRELLTVRRERLVPTGAPGTKEEKTGPDYFSPTGKSEIVAEGMVATHALQIEFRGQTATLRAFLNRVASVSSPVVVRSVEVEPIERGPTRDRSAAGGSLPVVLPGDSKFLVTLDLVELLPTRVAAK
ncbi:MAG TPA: Amuc_1100 family pilus-like protein [Candidatus Didemnitutus sp.]|nr:Amuc_1100 family pilus-like protein [Candidatus Didemnitutus sp.]